MKKKLSKILGVGVVLVLALSLSLVMAVPAVAGTMSVSVALGDDTEGVTTTYDIGFTTVTTYEVDTVDMEFDTDFDVSSATLAAAATGIGAGTVSVSGQTVTYTVTTLAVISIGTEISIALADIVNPSDGAYSEAVTVTTKSSTGAIVDTGTADVTITPVPVRPEVWVDATATLDGTVESEISSSMTLTATEEIFSTDSVGDAVEFLTGDDAGEFTTIATFSSATEVILTDTVNVANECDFNLVDLDTPSSGDPFRYIQSAVSTSAANTIVNVAAGTYTPSSEIVIGPAVTLKGANYGVNPVTETRGAESIIDLSGISTDGIQIHEEDFTIDGFTIDGSVSRAIFLRHVADTATIRNNIITNAAMEAISFSGSSLLTDVTISGNLIEDCACGVMLQAGAKDNTISNNTITGSTWAFDGAISLGGSNISNNTITHNTLVNNAGAGIKFWDSPCMFSGTGNEINYNNIYGNASYGIENLSGTPVDAENNWWGDASGPYNTTSNPGGMGDAVSNKVDYRPWLSEPYGVEEVTSVSLESGWNLVSLPLIPTSSAITDVLADVSSSVTIVQYYSAEAEGWLYYDPDVAESTLDTMEDGLGYWIKMSAAATLDVLGTEMPEAPALPHTYSVVEEWNLVGFKSTTPMLDETYLGNLGSAYSVLYGYDAVEEGYFSVYPMDEHSGNMEPGCGYWLWATADGTIVPPR